MPIRVHCPNGCLIRMPANRAGKIVRCPECKATIELPPISQSEQKSGKPIPILAVLIAPPALGNANLEEKSELPVDSILLAGEFVADADASGLAAIERAMERVGASAVPSENSGNPENFEPVEPPEQLVPLGPLGLSIAATDSSPAIKARLNIPSELSPVGIRMSELHHKAKRKEIMATVEPIVDVKPIVATPSPIRVRSRRVKPPAAPSAFELHDSEEVALEAQSWQERVLLSNSDRRVLARFFAYTVCMVAMINLLPAFIDGYTWYHAVETTILPRWIYLLVFVAAVHVIYAVLLFQIPDWSTLRAVSIALLGIAFVFGLFSTSLLFEGGGGIITNFLGLSYSIVQRAVIWCVAMLCLSTLMSYWGGREAAQWQRAEQLLIEILGKPTG